MCYFSFPIKWFNIYSEKDGSIKHTSQPGVREDSIFKKIKLGKIINLQVIFLEFIHEYYDYYFSENKIACVSLLMIMLLTGLALSFGFSTSVTNEETAPEYQPLCKLKFKLSIKFQTN